MIVLLCLFLLMSLVYICKHFCWMYTQKWIFVSWNMLIFTFSWYCTIRQFSKVVVPIYFLTSSVWEHCVPHPCSPCSLRILNFSQSGGYVVVSHWVFISLKTNKVEQLIFHVHWPFGDPLLYYAHFGVFFLLIDRNSLYILLVICIANISSHLVTF